MLNVAFVCFNRYLDIADAIEDGVNMLPDNAEFEGTEVPFRVKLPKKNLPVGIYIHTYLDLVIFKIISFASLLGKRSRASP